MKIALFKNIACNFTTVWDIGAAGENGEKLTGYLRISQWVDVDFPPVPSPDLVAAEVAVLDELIAETRRDFAEKLGAIERRKAELLALTFEPATEAVSC